jgi:type II secretion system protein J
LRIDGVARLRPIRAQSSIRNRGFTLIEMVTALLMVAMLAASMYASLQIAFRAQSAAEAAVEPARTADVAMELLRDDIQNAFPPSTTENQILKVFIGTDSTDSRGGMSDTLEFCSTADAKEHAAANGELKQVILKVNAPANSSDHILVREVARNLLTSGTEPKTDEEVICRGVAGFNLRYYDGGAWQDSWDSNTSTIPLPLAVEVTLQLDRPTPSGQTKTHKYIRVFPLSCATTEEVQQ